MSTNDTHVDDSPARSMNPNNRMSDGPGDGNRLTDNPEAIEKTPAEKVPPNDAQSEATVEEFGREGMGVSAKE